MKSTVHQYIQRQTNQVTTEQLFFDRPIQTIYSAIREKAPKAFDLLVSARLSAILGFLNYDFPVVKWTKASPELFERLGIDSREIYGSPSDYQTYRNIFERQIWYWDTRPMEAGSDCVVSPADSRVLPGTFKTTDALFIKEKLFEYRELIGQDRGQWLDVFDQGDYAVFRLTPDKYHYNHSPVAGKVLDIYEINGRYHSCNPGAVVRSVTPYSKNRRVVTVIDTDVDGGSHVGRVAMVEIVAMMIGRIVQCYSDQRYDHPQTVKPGLFIKKGQPKSLFRPGSSTTVLIFEIERIDFSEDLLHNRIRTDVISRFSQGFGRPLVETEVNVRETIAKRRSS